MKKILSLLLVCAMLMTCAALAAEYPVTVDNYGREVTIADRPERVLTLGPNVTELFAALGLGDLVIGRSLVNHSRGPRGDHFLRRGFHLCAGLGNRRRRLQY